MRKYLFVICPNQSGSSMIYRYLGRCKSAVKLSTEGQLVYGKDRGPVNMQGQYAKGLFSEYADAFSNSANYKWEQIKTAWEANWNGQSQGQIDPVKETTAYQMQVESGFITNTAATSQLNGSDWENNVNLLKKEKELYSNEKNIQENLST